MNTNSHARSGATPNEYADAALTTALDAILKHDLARADMLLVEAAERHPDAPHIRHVLGIARMQAGNLAGAIDALRDAMRLAPGCVEYLIELGICCMWAERPEEAEACFNRVFELDPQCASAHNALGQLARAAGDGVQARQQFRLALEINPDHAAALNNLAGLSLELGHIDQVEEIAYRALETNPQSAIARVTLGDALKARGRYAHAASEYGAAIKLDPHYAPAHLAFSFMLLAQGRFEEAWPHYAWREREGQRVVTQRLRLPPPPLPSLEACRAAGEIMLLGEQSLGIPLLFLRFARALAHQGFRLRFRGDERLHGMLMRTGHFESCLAPVEPLPGGVPALLVGDLPRFLGSVNVRVPLALTPDRDRLVRMRERLADAGPPPYVGVTWRAGELTRAGARRLSKTIPPTLIGAALASVPGTLIVVQRDPSEDELTSFCASAGRPAQRFSWVNDDLEEALALMSVLDDYVCVSNTNVYLRAASGKAADVLLPYPPDWRWLGEGNASPWFPGFRIYRQAPSLAWRDALADLREQLTLRGRQLGRGAFAQDLPLRCPG